MINMISNWAEQIIVAVVIATIIEMILPENTNKKYIKIVIGIYILFVIISPFVNKGETIDFNKISTNTATTVASKTEVNQETMDARLKKLYVEQIEKDITSKVEQEGYSVKKCKADVELDTDSENKGINKIELKIGKSEKNNNSNKSDSNVNKVEINIGLNKYIKKEKNENKVNDEKITKLKVTLSDYYQIDSKKIIITKD